MHRVHNLGLLFEMLRSFSSLAHTLNVSRSVRQLGITRQTMHRHIRILEQVRGHRLFRLEDQQYQLTEEGRKALPEAELLLSRGKAWLTNQLSHVEGLLHIRNGPGYERPYFLQQNPLGRLWSDGSPLLKHCVHCWAAAQGQLESDTFATVRPFAMVFRRQTGMWICVDVGKKSSYATWFGWTWEKSSVGRAIDDLPGGPDFANLLSLPFEDVARTEGMRLDHIYTHIAREPGGALIPISYQRLLLGCRFPDASFALVSIIDRTRRISIEGLDPGLVEPMSEELSMDIDPTQLASDINASC